MGSQAASVRHFFEGIAGDVVLLFSGGLASTVLLKAAVESGKRVTALYVDDGLMMDGDSERAREIAESFSGVEFRVLNMNEDFERALSGVRTSYEKSTKVVEKLLSAGSAEVRGLGKGILVWGGREPWTFAEQIGAKSPLIGVSYAELTGICAEMGLSLGSDLSWRLPVSGLASRVVGEVTSERLQGVRFASSLLKKASSELSRYVPILFVASMEGKFRNDPTLPRLEGAISGVLSFFGAEFVSVRMMRDSVDGSPEAAYGKVLAVEAQDEEGITVKPCKKMIGAVRDRLFYADSRVGRVIMKVAGPSGSGTGQFFIVRAVQTIDMITGEPVLLSEELMDRMGRELAAASSTSRLYFDITPKPPAAIEFE